MTTTKVLLALPLLALTLLGCGFGESQTVNTCDQSLNKCVQVLGDKHKEQCYQTYHSCVTKGCK